jgi:hypothetical protein
MPLPGYRRGEAPEQIMEITLRFVNMKLRFMNIKLRFLL